MLCVSVADQGLQSGMLFGITVGAARFLDPEQYGSFAALYTVFLFFVNVQHGLSLDPLSVLGSTVFSKNQIAYVFRLWKFNLYVSLFLMICVGAVGSMTWNISGSSPTFLFAFYACIPPLFSLGVFRRACYVLGQSLYSLAGSLTHALIVCCAIPISFHCGTQGPTIMALAMAVGAATGCSVIVALLLTMGNLDQSAVETPHNTLTADIFRHHWRYGKFAMGALVCTWLSWFSYAPVLGTKTLTDAAIYRAVDNAFLPLAQVLTAIWVPLLPIASRRLNEVPTGVRIVSMVKAASLGVVALSATYVLGTSWSFDTLAKTVYKRPEYTGLGFLPLVMGAFFVLYSASDFGIGLAFRALNRPELVLRFAAVGAVASVVIGLPLALTYGVWGAAVGRVIASAIQIPAAVLVLRHLVSRLNRVH